MADNALAAWVIARLLRGETVERDMLVQLPEMYCGIAQALVERNGREALEVFNAELSKIEPQAAHAIRAVVWAADPMSGTPPFGDEQPDSETSSLVDVDAPALPDAAQLSTSVERAAGSVGRWLSLYCEYASRVSPRTPAIFHESAGLWVGGLAIARRLCLRLAHGDIFPNLYVLWISLTTLFAKSTGLRILLDLVEDAVPHLLLSNEFTPEALLEELAGKEPTGLDDEPEAIRQLWLAGRDYAAQRGIVLDEASALFAGLRRDYLVGLSEMILRLYDGPRVYRRHTRAGGFAIARAAALSFIGATTPASLRRSEIAVAWQDGLLARFVLLTPEAEPRWSQTNTRPAPPADLVSSLRKLSGELLLVPTWPALPEARVVILDAEAFAAWQRYDRALTFDLLTRSDKPDSRLWGNYGRFPTLALKVAMIVAALDWAMGDEREPRVTLAHWARAQLITERWRESAHRLLETLSRNVEENGMEDRVIRLLAKADSNGLTIREVYRVLHCTRNQMEPIFSGLVRDGLAERISGPKAERYRLVSRGEASARHV